MHLNIRTIGRTEMPVVIYLAAFLELMSDHKAVSFSVKLYEKGSI